MDLQVKAALVAEAARRQKEENPELRKYRIEMPVNAIMQWLDGRKVDLSVTLGTGLGDFGKELPGMIETSYQSLHLPVGTMSAHASLLRYAQIGQLGVLLFSGRKHLYEKGVELDTALMAVRSAFFVGAKIQILTCAAGSVNVGYHPGNLVFVKDHINHLGVDPTLPFVAMTNVYDKKLLENAHRVAEKTLRDWVRKGVLASKRGPSFETPAEIIALRRLGADLAGMSIVHEAMALKELGARVLAISLITNYGAGIKDDDEITHEANTAEGAKAAERFSKVLLAIIEQL